MHETFVLPIEVTATGQDAELLEAIIRAVLGDGLAQYHHWGELAPFARLTVHLGAAVVLDDATLARRSRSLEARGFRKLLEHTAPGEDVPAQQLAMPGV